jgi:hypothetical protein
MTYPRERHALIVASLICLFLVCPGFECSDHGMEEGSRRSPRTEAEAAFDRSQRDDTRPTEQPFGYKRLPPEVAFRKGIQALQGRFDLFETNGVIQMSRSPRGYWILSFSCYTGTSLSGITFVIRDNGSVEKGGLL